MTDRVPAEINTPIGYTNRINALMWMIDDAAMNLDAYAWSHTLMALYREASTSMDDNEIKIAEGHILNITPHLNGWQKGVQNHGFSRMDSDFYLKLHKFELFLRRCLKDSGILTKVSQNPAFAISGEK